MLYTYKHMIRVGVLRGGTSSEYDSSLASGAYVLKNLPRDKYEPVDVFIDREGAWHIGGKPASYDKLQHRVDVVWNALGGFYGADGKVENVLSSLSIPYVGAGPFLSALTMHKKMSKDHLAAIGIETPRGIYIESWGEGSRDETSAVIVAQVAHDFSPPWIVVPISRSQGIEPARAVTLGDLSDVLGRMFDLGLPVSIEEEVLGERASVIALGGFRRQPTYTFLPSGSRVWRGSESEALQAVARTIHEKLGFGPYSRIEAVVTPRGRIFVTRIETVPSFAPGSEIHSALQGTGASFGELADHLLFSTLRRG